MKKVLLGLVVCLAAGLVCPIVRAVYLSDKPDSMASYQPTHLIVKFNPGYEPSLSLDKSGAKTGLADVDRLHERYGVQNQRPLLNKAAVRSTDNPLKSVYLLEPSSPGDIEAMASDYAALDAVAYALPDDQVELYELPNDSLYAHQWAMNNSGQGHYHVVRLSGAYNDTLAVVSGLPDADIDAQEVFQNPPDNTFTVVVAIVDTGVDLDHPELSSVIWTNPGEIADNGIDDDHNGYVDDVCGWDYSGNELGFPLWQDNDPTDTYGHGTHCAGIIAALAGNGIGVAGTVPTAKIMALKFYPIMLFSSAAAAIIYAADNGADVINMSWGLNSEIPVVEEALDYAAARGVILVASAGNDGYEVVNYPAAYSQTISVGASNDSDHVTPFSTINDFVDLCAPGQSILSLRGDSTDMYAQGGEPDVHIIDSLYYLASGTSMSSPYAVAVAAYMRSISPGLTHATARDIMQATCDDFIDPYGLGENYPGWDMYSGYGRISIYAALAATPRRRAVITSPRDFEVISGVVDITGSADGDEFGSYALEISSGHDGVSWTEIGGAGSAVTDGVLGMLDCTTFDDGEYLIRLSADETNQDNIRVFVTTGAQLSVTAPNSWDTVSGTVEVSGSAFCMDFRHTIIDYGLGETPTAWTAIDTLTSPVHDCELTAWQTSEVTDGLYTLRVSLYSDTGLVAQENRLLMIKSPFYEPDGWTLPIGERLARSANYLDIDQDGDYEIIIGTSTTIKVVNLDGSLQSTGIPTFVNDDYTIVAIAVGTLDADSLDDFVAVGGSGTMYVYPSIGPAFQVALPSTPKITHYLPGEGANAPKVFLRDINNDGVDEIHYFPGIFWGSLHYYIYNADGSLRLWNNGMEGAPANYETCHPADLDGDNICELYCYGPDLRKFDTSGNSATEDYVDLVQDGLELSPSGLSISSVDIDGDGKEELILYGMFSIDPWNQMNYWIYAFNEGLELVDGFPHNTGINGASPMSEPVFCDLNADGELEYMASKGNALCAWNLDGTPFLGDSSSLGFFAAPEDFGRTDLPLLADISGNGEADVMTRVGGDSYNNYHIGRLEAYSSAGELLQGFPQVIKTEPSLGSAHIPCIGDLNQDGYLDVLSPSAAQKLVFHQYKGVLYRPDLAFSTMWRYDRRLSASSFPFAGIEIGCGDVNGDGYGPDIADLVFLVTYMFQGGPEPRSLWACDVDGSGSGPDIADLVYLVTYMFQSGPAPDCPER